MSNTSITNVEITDTFQVWINKTNELIDLANENVMLAGPSGFTVTGNSTLTGTFTANTLNANTSSIDSISTINLSRAVDANESIVSSSPIRISSSVENIFDLESTTGNRPILRMTNGGNARWVLGHSTADTSSPITVRTEGAANPQFTLTQGGRLTVNEIEGDGSLLTNLSVDSVPDLDASKITSGTLDVARIPDLDAGKITSGTVADARLPASATRGEISITDLTSTSSSSQNFITGRRFRAALTWNNVANKPSTFTPSSHTHDASAIVSGTVADARLPASATRSEIGISDITNESSDVQGFISGRRFKSALDQFANAKGYIVFNGATGATLKSKNLTVSKTGTGNYWITTASSIRDGSSNWGVVISNIDDGDLSQTLGTINSSTVNDFQAEWWNIFVYTRSSSVLKIRAKRTYSQWFSFKVGNDNGGGNAFAIDSVDPQYVAIMVF